MSEYDKQAKDFLTKVGAEIDMQQIRPNLAFRPIWAEKGKLSHGFEYRVSIYKLDQSEDYKDYRFTFWDSLANAQANKRPTKYDILASLSLISSDTFEDFCDELGYDKDSIKSRETWKLVKAEQAGLKKLFSDDELAMLAEIQ